MPKQYEYLAVGRSSEPVWQKKLAPAFSRPPVRLKYAPPNQMKETITMNLTVIDHPLIKHKITLMRKANCNTYQFRTLVKELARLMAYEASRHLETEPLSIEGWCGRIEGEQAKP